MALSESDFEMDLPELVELLRAAFESGRDQALSGPFPSSDSELLSLVTNKLEDWRAKELYERAVLHIPAESSLKNIPYDSLSEEEKDWWIGKTRKRPEGSNVYGGCSDCGSFRWLVPTQLVHEMGCLICQDCFSANELIPTLTMPPWLKKENE